MRAHVQCGGHRVHRGPHEELMSRHFPLHKHRTAQVGSLLTPCANQTSPALVPLVTARRTWRASKGAMRISPASTQLIMTLPTTLSVHCSSWPTSWTPCGVPARTCSSRPLLRYPGLFPWLQEAPWALSQTHPRRPGRLGSSWTVMNMPVACGER